MQSLQHINFSSSLKFSPQISSWFQSLPLHKLYAFIWAFILLTIGLIACYFILKLLFKLIRIFHHSRENFVILEIVPPQNTEIAAVSTSQLFSLISNLLENGSFIDKVILRQTSCALEIVSQKETGIRYLLRVPENIAKSIEKSLRAYISGIKIKETTDYLSLNSYNKQIKVIEFKLTKHFSLPLNEQPDLNKHDPLAYLTGNMTQLQNNDILSYQIVLRPLSGFSQWSINREVKRIQLSSNDQANLELIQSKIEKPLCEATVRALLILDKEEMPLRAKGLCSSFSSFLHPSGQSLILSRELPFKAAKNFRFWQYKERLSGLPLYLSTSEVAALYHFPFETNAHAEDMTRIKSRMLPTPLSLKNNSDRLDVTVGINNYAGEIFPIGLTLQQRQKHMYVIGKTGTGKTTLLTNAIYQDMVNGKGLAVFDPHGDMLQEILRVIPEHRRKDVILFDPSDRDFPIGLNLLSPGINFTNKEDEQEWITSSVISAFAKITAKEYWGPRMEHILRNTTLTALQLPNPSLFTLQRLLTEKKYQKQVAANLKDPVLKQFWSKEFALLGTMQLSSATAPLTQRIGHFITSKMSRHILLQEKSTINMSQIMDEGKIFLANLSKGDLGEDQSFFFGTILTSIIWMAAYQRIKIPEKQRRDFFLYVDEFQNFATPRFSEITSEGRKFHISLTASHQNIAQVEDSNILKVVAGNANTIICLKASPDDEKFILPFMEPEVEKGDIVNLPPYHFFMKVTNENSENAFSGQTVPLNVDSSEETKSEAVEYSRKHHALPRAEVEKYLERMFSGQLEEPPSSKQIMKTKKKETPKPSKQPEKAEPKLYQVADTEIDKL